MQRPNRSVIETLGVVLGMLVVQQVSAQIQVESVDYQGVVTSVTPQAIGIRTTLGDYVADLAHREVNLEPARIMITGKESPKFLQAGMVVRFEADMELRRTVRSDITQVSVIDRGPTTAFGVFQVDPPPPPPSEVDPRKPPKPLKMARYRIVGLVKSMRRGRLSVEVLERGRSKTISAAITDEAVVDLEFTNLARIRPGDKIRANGMKPVGNPGKQFWATGITVTRAADPAANLVAAKPEDPKDPGKRPDPFKAAAKPEEPAKPADGTEVKGVILRIN